MGDHAGGERGTPLAEDDPPHRFALGMQLHAHWPLKLDQHERGGVRAQAARFGGGRLAFVVKAVEDLAQGRAAATRVTVRLDTVVKGGTGGIRGGLGAQTPGLST